ncbi:SusC/RagA family TonB-linked outer membrane protein [Aquimarina gracilis]|uniref:SusC/RagA family TonB-linked outer membrane protein n=1 Tax=Aquimarina gracilis TaxID=874422 RepID=A0ABU5ZSG2_9FLAO|nr:SusC/RagA family TonB-linked outer membrane protein [Aquimarina gracilis]MEB3344888.1 SusC/RagA family TonB-linked outer membrane protein [Aquimarina gracilis]
MKTSIRGLLMLFLALVVHFSYAQEKTVTGTVTDNGGTPLPGVNIFIKGTNSGTQSDFDGNYSINVNQGGVLTFSYLGFATQEVSVGSGNQINVKMQEDAAVLEEVVVTGVASGTSKRKLGVAVNSVKSEDLQVQGAQAIDQALQGKIAGTIIQSTTGQPGQQQNIVLRAINSLNSSQPMILIDGVQVSTSQTSIGGASNQSSRLADIDFTNVERVETISGAAAGTIYGAQGANGVINIITKKGKAGAPKVSVRTNVSIASAITNDDANRATLHHYSTNANGFLVDLNGTPVTDLNSNAQYLAVDPNERDVNGTNLGAEGINDTPFAENTFLATDILFKEAFNTTTGVSVSGGSENISYLVSGNRSEQESVLVVGKYIKYDARLSLGFDLGKKIKINTRFDVINSTNDTGTNTDNANASNLINNVFQNLPHVDFFNRNSDGDLTVSPDATDPNSINPFFFREIQTRQDDITRYLANFDLVYNPFKVLSLNIKYGYDTYTQNFSFFQENQSSHLQSGSIPTNIPGIINQVDTQEYFQNLLISANLTLDFQEDLGLNIPVTSTTTFNFDWRDQELRQTSVTGTNLPAGPFGSFNINQAAVKTFNGFFESPFRTYGFLINQKFDYESLFGFSGGFRRDFSNRFGNGLDFTFPRADAYFNIAELFESDMVNTLKLRAAYGEAGIQPLFSQNLFTFALTTVGSETLSSIPSTVSNPDLEVETSQETEIGIDYTFSPSSGNWFSRLDGSVNYFDRKTEGAIFDLGIPSSTGGSAVFNNSYDISSDGIEASIDLNMYRSDKINWNFGVRFTKSTAILDRIENGLPVVVNDNFVLQEGQEIGTFSVFPVLTSLDQLDNSGNRIIAEADVDNFTVASSGYVVNKNTGRVAIGPDKVVAGSTQPDFVLTFLNDVSLFNDIVGISFQIDWFQGLDVYNRARQWLYNNGLHNDTAAPISIEDPTGAVQTGAFVAYYTSLYNTNVPTSEFVEDGSFVRLRDVSLRLRANKLIKAGFFDNIDLTISGRNLLTITDYKGLDPEAARGFGNTFQRGFDEFTHPNVKSYNFGLNLTF